MLDRMVVIYYIEVYIARTHGEYIGWVQNLMKRGKREGWEKNQLEIDPGFRDSTRKRGLSLFN